LIPVASTSIVLKVLKLFRFYAKQSRTTATFGQLLSLLLQEGTTIRRSVTRPTRPILPQNDALQGRKVPSQSCSVV
jgi:hypothetical protein